MIFHSSFLMERRAFVKPNYLVFMKNVRKYLGLVSMSLVCASPLAAMVIQPFVGVTIVQQNVITVKGQVMDEKGEAIIGANVIVEGTAQGMITDMNGNFSFQCPVGAILKVSYIGYLSQTIKVSGNAGTLKVILKEDAETLDEVVVVGYGMVKKSDLTGSVASVNVDEMAKRNPVNIGQALQGAAAGVQVNDIKGIGRTLDCTDTTNSDCGFSGRITAISHDLYSSSSTLQFMVRVRQMEW